MRDIEKSWTCPRCGRKFERKGQFHSCRAWPIVRHFTGKPYGRSLYEKLKRSVKEQTGAFKIESLECCIHFVSSFTFAAVWIFKDKIRVEFALGRKLRNKRVGKMIPVSASRNLYCIDITREEEVDQELLDWILEARERKKVALKIF